jgi:ketosteroid isomerase-like protein
MRSTLALLLLAAAPAALSAQKAPDEKAILAATQYLFDGMRTHDTTTLKRVLQPDAAFFTVMKDKEGKTVVRRMRGQDFIDAVGKGGEAWNESIRKPEVRQDGDLATVWGYFTFSLGDKQSHCGVDQFTLARVEGEWKMISAADTHWKKEDCTF